MTCLTIKLAWRALYAGNRKALDPDEPHTGTGSRRARTEVGDARPKRCGWARPREEHGGDNPRVRRSKGHELRATMPDPRKHLLLSTRRRHGYPMPGPEALDNLVKPVPQWMRKMGLTASALGCRGGIYWRNRGVRRTVHWQGPNPSGEAQIYPHFAGSEDHRRV